MEANILPAASEIRGSIGPTHFIGSKMEHHKSRSAEGAHPSVRAPGLVPLAWVLGLPAPAERITSTTPADNLDPCPGQPCSQTCSHRTPKWVGSHQDPDDC